MKEAVFLYKGSLIFCDLKRKRINYDGGIMILTSFIELQSLFHTLHISLPPDHR
jgi:hypothetical protein